MSCTAIASFLSTEQVNKSFKAQRADYHFLYRPSMRDESWRLGSLFLNKQVEVINASYLGEWEKEELIDLFFRILRRTDYDRSLIAPRSSLEVILDKRVYMSHQNPGPKDPVTGRRIYKTIAEAYFAYRLGVKPQEERRIYYLLDRYGKRIGVFKAPITHVKPSDDRYGAAECRVGHLAEVASFKTDEAVQTHIAPYTTFLKIDLALKKSVAGMGSFQFYLRNPRKLSTQLEGENLWDPDHEALAARLDTPANRNLKFHNFEEMVFFDLLVGNNDGHFENILIKKRLDGTWKLVMIDNSNAFPWCHDLDLPASKMRPLHWFKWSALPHAQKPFSDSMIARINALDLRCIEKILRENLVSPDVPASYEHIEEKINTLRDRFDLIKRWANQKAYLSAIADGVLSLTHNAGSSNVFN